MVTLSLDPPMHTRVVNRSLQLLLLVIWAIAAFETVRASGRPTYRESQIGAAAQIEWLRVGVVWILLAAEVSAFGALLRVLATATSRTERAIWIAVGVFVALALSMTVRSHGPDEHNLPGRVALVLLLGGAVLGVVSMVRGVVARSRTGGRTAHPVRTSDHNPPT